MEFFIRQGATDPVLKLKLVDDGKNDKSIFNDLLENSIITFDMLNIKTNDPIILNGSCQITNRITKFGNVTDDYYIIYQFSEEDTSLVGRFEGKITIKFLDENRMLSSKLIVPIREKLFINVI